MNAKRLLLAPLCAIAAGCSWMGNDFRDRGNDYLHAEPIRPIVVPEKYQSHTLEELYVVPKLQTDDFDLTKAFEAPRPQPLSANDFTESVKIQKLGQKRWILVNSPPAEVWPRIRNFMTSNQIPVVNADAIQGTLDSAWLQFKESPETRDRYRVFVEQGVQPDSTEIHIRHLATPVSEQPAMEVQWPELSANPEREAWMLDELAATLASDAKTGVASLLAQNIGAGQKISVRTISGEPVLHMALSFERARATIAHALRSEGFTTFEADSDLGIFYVGYERPHNPDEDSWFSNWFGGSSEQVIPTTPYTLAEVLSHLQLENTPENRAIFNSLEGLKRDEKLANVPGYLVIVRGADDELDIRVRDGYGNRLHKLDAKEKLNIIRRNLI